MYLCDHKCENSIYVLMHRTSQIKHCKNPMDFQIKALMEGELPNSPSFGHIVFPPKQQHHLHEVLGLPRRQASYF